MAIYVNGKLVAGASGGGSGGSGGGTISPSDIKDIVTMKDGAKITVDGNFLGEGQHTIEFTEEAGGGTESGPIDISSGVTGILPVENGGTGVNNLEALKTLLGGNLNNIIKYYKYKLNTNNMATIKIADENEAPFSFVVLSAYITGENLAITCFGDYIQEDSGYFSYNNSAYLYFRDGMNPDYVGLNHNPEDGNVGGISMHIDADGPITAEYFFIGFKPPVLWGEE